MKEFTNAQKETLRVLFQQIRVAETTWNNFVKYLMLEYGVDDNWEFTFDGFKEKENKPKEVKDVPKE